MEFSFTFMLKALLDPPPPQSEVKTETKQNQKILQMLFLAQSQTLWSFSSWSDESWWYFVYLLTVWFLKNFSFSALHFNISYCGRRKFI